jgi:GntR family transcriptional regulator
LRYIHGSEDVCKKLQLSNNSQVIELIRIRYADNIPMMVETAYLPKDQFSDLTEASLDTGSLYKFLSLNYGVIIASVDQELHPVLLDNQQAKLLNLVVGSPAMHSEVIEYSQDQKPVDFSISIINGEICRFYFRFREEGN